jgi:hypothetical protein
LVPGQSRPNDAGPSASDQTSRAERRSFRETVFHCHPGEGRDAPPALPTRSQRKNDDACQDSQGNRPNWPSCLPSSGDAGTGSMPGRSPRARPISFGSDAESTKADRRMMTINLGNTTA